MVVEAGWRVLLEHHSVRVELVVEVVVEVAVHGLQGV